MRASKAALSPIRLELDAVLVGDSSQFGRTESVNRLQFRIVRSILAPERDQLRTTSLDDGTTAADLAEELAPEPLAELSLARVDELENDDEEFLASVAREAETYGADEIRMIAMLLDTAEGQVIGGAVAVRYGEEWGLMSLTTPLLDVLPGQVEPVTEEGYLEALESAGTRY